MKKTRWKKAQEKELIVWKRAKKEHSCKENLQQMPGSFKLFRNIVEQHLLIETKSRILEIGGAGCPLSSHFQSGFKISCDPLESEYSTLFGNRTIAGISSLGEQLPFRNNSFDLVVILNVLDHCLNPEKVVNEICRVLEPEGCVLLSVDHTSTLWSFLRKAKLKMNINLKENHLLHPHSFSLNDIGKLLRRFESLFVCDFFYFPDEGLYNWPRASIKKRVQSPSRYFFLGRKQK